MDIRGRVSKAAARHGAQGRSGARRNAKKELCFWCFAESHRCERAATVRLPASRFSGVHDTSFVLSFQRWSGRSEPIEIGRCLAKNKHWRGPCKPRKVAMSSGLYCTVRYSTSTFCTTYPPLNNCRWVLGNIPELGNIRCF